MKKIFFIYGLVLMATLAVLSSCNNQQQKVTTGDTHKDLYTCSMHPQVIQDHPGNCPICGMQLIKKNPEPVVIPTNIQLESLLKPVNEYVITSLPVTTLQLKSNSTPVKAFGTIEYDARATSTIAARVSGRIEKLYVRYRYEEVEKGQKIMDIYSPEIVTAEQNLLFLLKNDAQNTSFIKAAKEKLLLLGMSDEQLQQAIQSGKPIYAISVYSNYSGHIHESEMQAANTSSMQNGIQDISTVTEELPLKEGMYVQKGQTLFMIMNHHQAWAALQIYSTDQSLIKTGDAVTLIPEADTTDAINGNIDFIEPFFRANSKTLTARVYFHNALHLPVGSHLTAFIYPNNKQNAAWLPQSAVISLGLNEVAFIKTDGGFQVHKIITGIQNNNEVQVLSGLNATDTVAVNAQYLIDSESFIKTSSN
jgi:membrane fusion protein, copper/silver efflux system